MPRRAKGAAGSGKGGGQVTSLHACVKVSPASIPAWNI